MADSAAEATDLHEKFQEMALRFLGAEIDNRGYIPLDRYVREAVKRQIPFVLASPPTPAAEGIGEVAGALLERESISELGRTGLFARALQQRNWSKRAD
jgi:flagellar biosynthesis protein FlhG